MSNNKSKSHSKFLSAAAESAKDILGLKNPWIVNDFESESGNTNMNDEEIYYIAIFVSDLKTLKEQRAVFDIIHLKCDDDTVARFKTLFSNENLNKIMLSC